MGKQIGIITFKGKVGNVVGARDSKGDLTLKAYQPEVKQANTEGQIIARVRFLTLTGLAKLTRNVHLGLSAYADANKLTLTNAFSKLNKLAVECYPPDLTANPPRKDYEGKIDWHWVKFAHGDIPNVLFRTPDYSTPGEISADFTDNELDGMTDRSATTRRAFLVAVCPDMGAAFISNPVASNVGAIKLPVPLTWNGMMVHTYGFAMDFNTQSEALAYDSYWSRGPLSLEAKASLAQMMKNARYSMSQYLKSGEIG